MSAWMYDGYTKVKVGTGRHARMVEKHIYKCLHCGWSVRVEGIEKPPILCLCPLLAQIAISLAVLAENVQGEIDQRNAIARLFTGDGNK